MSNRAARHGSGPFVSRIEAKPPEFYRGIRVKADYQLHDQIAKRVAAMAPPTGRILDFGCGEGALSQRLSDAGYSVLAVDVDATQFRASTPFAAVDFNRPDAVAEFVRGHSEEFDLVLAIEVIEHLENPWEYLRVLAALTRPGGLLIVTTPNVTSWYSRVTFLFTGRFHQFAESDRSYGHINPVAEDELKYIATSVGLEAEEVTSGGWLPALWLVGGARRLAANLLGFVLRPFMRGTSDGWCLMAVFRKPLT